MVRVCLLVVDRVPSPEIYVALLPLFAEMDAVGVPELTLMNANLEDTVALLPRSRSRVEVSFGVITPFTTFQLVPPLPVQLPNPGAPPPLLIRHSPRLPAEV